MSAENSHPDLTVSPAQRYQADIEVGKIVADPAQAEAITHLERIFAELLAHAAPVQTSLWSRLRRRPQARWHRVPGLYLWGEVGRGKTYLVDQFFDALPGAGKQRIHFHHFMRNIHHELNQLDDTADPLQHIATQYAEGTRVLCLDEFHVADITDAMILGNLLEALFNAGLTLIATSNDAPDDLYAGGLQRERFLPAIALIQNKLVVHELVGANDYRLRALEQAPIYFVGEQGTADDKLAARFDDLAPSHVESGRRLSIEGRQIETVQAADGIAWFEFDVLCGGPRSTGDYIELARTHHTLVLGNIPRLGRDDNDAARRLINLIDEIYDRRVNLIVSAAAEPEALYEGTRLAQPFRRTASRLHEMRSHEYLAQAHISD